VSKIVSPYPMYEGEVIPAADAAWWRLRITPNADGVIVMQRGNAQCDDMSTATWVSWEFFDDYDVVLDTGFDKPTKVRLHYYPSSSFAFVDVLHDGAPTPSPHWQRLTDAGDFKHPDDREPQP
jgi:hypothetical protein